MDQKETKSVIALTESGVLSPFALQSYRVAPSLSSLCCRFLSCLFIISSQRIAHLVGNVVSLWPDLAESHVSLPSRRDVMLYRAASHRIVCRAEPSLLIAIDGAHTVTQIDCHARGVQDVFKPYSPPSTHFRGT
jgi:hypothetical protein